MDTWLKWVVLLAAVILRQWTSHINATFTKELLFNFPEENEADKSIAFVTAHPDDESMFFTPLLELLSSTPSIAGGRVRVELISLTKGDFAGLGDVRIVELDAVCRRYKVNCTVVDESEWQDGPSAWDVEKVSERIEEFVNERGVGLIFTFDRHGASGHPNHISVHEAVLNMKKRLPGVTVWRLHTYAILNKYFAPFAVVRSLFVRPSLISFSPLKVIRNMSVHRSQWRWYLYLWSLFGSYSYTNSFDIL
ncbi:N-acetylglucosaminyl-phosphatidylinositol de-n-acetylase, putative [Babesia ovata]|uniref:N-acetylglucosaminylphosphatidylinositol deacetylase n=1 Tax=Babesia ovata TaxID=189622 RepID=A0A2H6K7E5_9APIC|nr:N-acetylglucosaminyl-phosphatidylinositol de-n-acetylase, putative [Babesia ovata]GBE58869.1 N-acetylglucosaminyl-phosphatidylinositol de-n-acetylase, putative [Babesia ovata]